MNDTAETRAIRFTATGLDACLLVSPDAVRRLVRRVLALCKGAATEPSTEEMTPDEIVRPARVPGGGVQDDSQSPFDSADEQPKTHTCPSQPQ